MLGLGVAASGLSTSSAQDLQAAVSSPTVVTTVTPDVKQPSAFQRDASTISRSSFRAALTTPSEADGLAPSTLAQAAEVAAEPGEVDPQAAKARTALLKAENAAADKRSEKLEKKRAAAKKKAEAAKRALGKSTMPVKHYSIAARFGDVGAWARYHTGFDFSAPVGTTIYAPTAGVVEHAGSGGEAGGWAGNYVVLKHADGTQTLYAHMSSISVKAGERVTGSTKLGHVGMTGRSFGPHLHFEVYPAGTTPGDVYKATNPQPWLNKLGLKP
ncbi:M23 family metallopeptidase [Nocardioides sp.]|uniref:M23 family metallopeptidase n=1 Tax=Nocardioides sp. TaxID=35761 RepID=UPI002D7F56DB|nr:M23 family metallopeptidase [Nocardioides sp.]HET8961777.1 M23 family metallopeptidase [Nocardioides sp.]